MNPFNLLVEWKEVCPKHMVYNPPNKTQKQATVREVPAGLIMSLVEIPYQLSANGTESEDEPARPGSEAIRPTICGDESSQVYETKPVDKTVISCQVVKTLHI